MYDRSVPLSVEFSHMTINHMHKEKTTVDAQPKPPTPPVVDKPILKFRRLSGDLLSATTPSKPTETPAIQISQVKSLAPALTMTLQPIAPKAPEMSIKISNVASGPTKVQALTSPTLKISNVVSLGEQQRQSQPQLPIISVTITPNPDPGLKMLKPWCKSVTQKSKETCNMMLQQLCLYSLFKCMAVDCNFSNSSAETMLQHYRHHEVRTPVPVGFKATWLECSYCDDSFDRSDLLVQHVLFEHGTSIFQCPHCFYRACAAHNVLLHIRMQHKEAEAFVLVCRGKAKLLAAELPSIFNARTKNVRSIPCSKGEIRLLFYQF